MACGIWQSLGIDFVHINVLSKFVQNITHGSRVTASFIFFRILTSAKSRPMTNGISQYLGLELVNISAYVFVQEIGPVSPFAEFGTRQCIDRPMIYGI